MDKISQNWLKPTEFIDFEHPAVQQFIAKVITGAESKTEQIIKLYYAVRDEIYYNPYSFNYERDIFKASVSIENKEAFCVPKAILFCAVARAIGIPSRLGFADVKNHLSTKKLRALLRSDIYRMHGCTLLYLDHQWVKTTPVFNIELCEKFGVKPLEFDGKNDSLLHPFNHAGDKHMEYLKDYGAFDDMPLGLLVDVYSKNYPHLFTMDLKKMLQESDFNQEAEAEYRKT